jgi:hypothetical protein
VSAKLECRGLAGTKEEVERVVWRERRILMDLNLDALIRLVFLRKHRASMEYLRPFAYQLDFFFGQPRLPVLVLTPALALAIPFHDGSVQLRLEFFWSFRL